MPREQLPRNHPERRLHWAWGEVALAEQDFGTALAIADHLLESAFYVEVHRPIPLLLRLKGRALIGLGRMDDAEAALLEARRGALEGGVKPWLWQIQRDLAALYQASGRHADADREAREADVVVEELAATIDDPLLRERFVAAAEPASTRRKPTARQAEKAAFGGLTAREREVAALVARGKSNRDMADELVLGERTIETHVGNILSKLGFSSRAQIAAWAVESGLLARAE
jgi:DNA-binding CsgD family transcriptional regulator